MSEVSDVRMEPMDEHNQALVNHVHPPAWENPTPAARYNLVVIGAGTAGLVTAAGAAGLGAKVALVERNLMGGDCLNVGCVPSKLLIRSGRAAAQFREAARFGVGAGAEPEVDFAAVMTRMRELRAGISHVDSAQRFRDELGVDVFFGDAQFDGSGGVEVGGQTLRYKRAVIATGARASGLPIEGLEEAGYFTNETVFSLTERPRRLAVIGGGPIGCELAQAFRCLGSEVTLIEAMPQFLGREDPDAAAIVLRQMRADGLEVLLGTQTDRVSMEGAEKVLHVSNAEGSRSIGVDAILLGVGRRPNIEGLNLESVGVRSEAWGIEVDDYMRTSNPAIYAAGDVCMRWKFTHAADFAARTVIQNALFSVGAFGRAKLSRLTMPWCTYTSPEIAHVGLYEREAEEAGLEVDTFMQPMSEVDRAIVDGDTDGFVKIHVRRGSDRIVGATIVAPNAGDLISEITLGMVNGVGLKGVAKTIHPYPTMADAIRKVGDQYNRSRLSPRVAGLMARWMSFRR